MNKYVTERLMTIDEAMRLSDPDRVPTPDSLRYERAQWSWQTLSSALEQTADTDLDGPEDRRQ